VVVCRRDKSQRPELCNGSVELVAPAEYMVRPPQAPVYVFVLDVSYPAVASGMVRCVPRGPRNDLMRCPEGRRREE
jgi:protein transport protein SEC24